MERCPSWPKEHDWKSCVRLKRTVGSNPTLSATEKEPERLFFCGGESGITESTPGAKRRGQGAQVLRFAQNLAAKEEDKYTESKI